MNPQAKAWATEFGDAYHLRNEDPDPEKLARFFTWTLQAVAGGVRSVTEFGAGDGRNLLAIASSGTMSRLDWLNGVEVNPSAFARLQAGVTPGAHVCGSILEPGRVFPSADLVVTKGLLIHLAPRDLDQALDVLEAAARKYVLLCEYYAPQPESVPYHGFSDRCWRNDYAGIFRARHPDFALTDYGFVYRRDADYSEDDVTWFLLRRRSL